MRKTRHEDEKRFHQKKRVTLYYSAVLIAIAAALFIVFYFAALRQMDVVSQDTVMKAVQNSFDDITAGDDFIGDRQRL